MFPDYHLMSALVADHRSSLEDGARKRRLLRGGRRADRAARADAIHANAHARIDRTITAVGAVEGTTPAPRVASLGRTPSQADRAA